MYCLLYVYALMFDMCTFRLGIVSVSIELYRAAGKAV